MKNNNSTKGLFILMISLLLTFAMIFSSCGSTSGTTDNTEEISGAERDTSASQETSDSTTSVSVEDAGDNSSYSSADDIDGDYVRIELNDGDTVISGEGASVTSSGNVKITAAGVYWITGELNGRLIVNIDNTTSSDEENTAEVELILAGVTINATDSSAISVKGTKSVTITLADGTVNTLTDTADYVFDEGEDEPDATLFSKNDLTLRGNGTLVIDSNYSTGIKSKGTLTIQGGTYEIESVGKGIVGKDYVTISGGDFTINAGAEGIKSTEDTDTSLGYINITGGTFDITSVEDAIQAVTDVVVSGTASISIETDQDGIQGNNVTVSAGTIDIKAGGGYSNASAKASEWGNMWGSSSSTSTDTAASAKGIKGVTSVNISGGTITVDSADDSIHSNGNITVSGGTVTVSSGDDGFHADDTTTIDGGTISVLVSYEGIEGSDVIVNGGNISVVASDDGFNAGGGSDGSSSGGMMGSDPFSQSSGDYLLKFTGGTVYVNAQGDGIDSNGDIEMTGGTVIVDGPTNGGNGAIDTGDAGQFSITGGTLIAGGATGMAETPTASVSSVPIVYFGYSISSGTTLTVKDSSGNTVLTYTPSKGAACTILASDALVSGQTYTFSYGSSSYSVTLSSGINSVGSSASSGMGGMGDMGNMGNMGGMGGGPGGR